MLQPTFARRSIAQNQPIFIKNKAQRFVISPRSVKKLDAIPILAEVAEQVAKMSERGSIYEL
jgi:hypothetical protein